MTAPAEPTPRVAIERIAPCVDHGRFPVKRVCGETVVVEADVFADGHDAVASALLYRPESQSDWQRVPMAPAGNDRSRAEFTVERLGRYEYTILAWVDPLATWRADLAKKHSAGQDVSVDLQRGMQLVRAAAARAGGEERRRLEEWALSLGAADATISDRVACAQADELHDLARRYPDPAQVSRHEPPLAVTVDRERARFSTWYEMFPRSAAAAPGAHGTLADCEARLAYVAEMGFDVLYLPPIHPIGITQRKGANGRTGASPGDPGSPWAIGSAAGGHKAIHPDLGTLEDFRRLLARAAELGIEVALDLAFQCSPYHPYVREHPEWFLERPDGTIQYAENPPKKYEDIYPFHFETPAWRELWRELASVVEFWIEQGVRIFRVDNPHTKPFAFWEWLIGEVRRRSPEVIFLAEAFTRPKVMHRLAKLGFTQSYTYFAWRNTRSELERYFRELGSAPSSEYLRPNLWPNTPDILTEYLQFGGRAAFMARLVLAATLGASYGLYGPAFELMEHEAREPGCEEYRTSEKYQIRLWSLDRPDSLRDFVARVNRIRRENPALQRNLGVTFHPLENETLIAYSKATPDHLNVILTVVNLDPHHAQSGWLHLDLAALGIDADQPFQVHDLLSGARFLWKGRRSFVRLDPQAPTHILRVRRRLRTERDFDYFL
ncbi:MAG: alpha-1,4-glucan--maltose-1-phosphate maltosyltransferase [Steroidobacteraceae bacterium]